MSTTAVSDADQLDLKWLRTWHPQGNDSRCGVFGLVFIRCWKTVAWIWVWPPKMPLLLAMRLANSSQTSSIFAALLRTCRDIDWLCHSEPCYGHAIWVLYRTASCAMSEEAKHTYLSSWNVHMRESESTQILAAQNPSLLLSHKNKHETSARRRKIESANPWEPTRHPNAALPSASKTTAVRTSGQQTSRLIASMEFRVLGFPPQLCG